MSELESSYFDTYFSFFEYCPFQDIHEILLWS
jgi:hypothetical protein